MFTTLLQHQSQSSGFNYPRSPPLRFLPREAASSSSLPSARSREELRPSSLLAATPPVQSATILTDDRARRRPPPIESAFDGLNAVPAALELRAKDSTVESNPPPPSASTDARTRRRPPPMESAFDGLDATPREGTAVPAALELRAKDSTVELVLDAGAIGGGATGGGAGQQRAGEGEGDYASLGAPDPEEERVIDNLTIMQAARPASRDKRLSFPQSVRDVVLGSGEIMVDDVKCTVSHVVEPMERSFSKINQALHQISENVKQIEKQKRKAKDDSYLIPLEPWSEEFSEAHDHVSGGSVSDSGLARKRHNKNTKKASSSLKLFEFRFGRWF